MTNFLDLEWKKGWNLPPFLWSEILFSISQGDFNSLFINLFYVWDYVINSNTNNSGTVIFAILLALKHLKIILILHICTYRLLRNAGSPSHIIVLQSLSCVWLFASPWTIESQTLLSYIISQRLLNLMSIEFMIVSYCLILCHILLLFPSVFPSIRVFSNDLAFHTK